MLTNTDTARDARPQPHARDGHRARLHPLLAVLGIVPGGEPIPGLAQWRRSAGPRPLHARGRRVG